MKILLVIPYFTPKRGGATTVLCDLANELTQRGHEVTLLTTDYQYDKEYAQRLKNAQILPFKYSLRLGLFIYSPKMKRWLKDNIVKFDLVHMHKFRSYQNILIAYYAKKNNVPFIIQPHGSLPRFEEKKRLKWLFDIIFGKRLLYASSKLVALNLKEKKQFESLGVRASSIEIIPNGIKTSEYQNALKQDLFREKYNIKKSDLIVLYLGRLHQIKGVDLLIQSYANVLNKTKSSRLVIVGGDDGLLLKLKEQVDSLSLQNAVLFTGSLYGLDKIHALCDADIFVLPSRYEMFPISILEAAACGTAVISTKNCGIEEVVQNFGLVVDFDRKTLADALLTLMNDDEFRFTLGNRGKHLIMENYGWNTILNQYERMYLDVIQSNY